MSDISKPALTDTSDMPALHAVFRKAFAAAPDLIGRAPADDTGRSALVGTYYDNVLRLLHAHHAGEDELVWPKLLERCPDDAEMVSEIAFQHEVVSKLMDVTMSQLQQWAGSASQRDAAALAELMRQLNDDLVAHLDAEEAMILPLCARYITQQEWGELPQHGMKHFDGDKPWLIMGLIFDNMPDGARDYVLANLPPPVGQMWVNFGSTAYASFMADLGISA
jgi:iron-sulfur cluster repair protein YtfE (RIC family)